MQYGMCCPDTEAETPPKGPVNATPVWRPVRSGAGAAREVWREKGWAWDEHDSDQLTETFRDELWERYGIEGADVNWSLSSCQGDGVAFAATPNIRAMAAHDKRLQPCIDAAEVLLAVQGADYEADWGVQISHEGTLLRLGRNAGQRGVPRSVGEHRLDSRRP